VLAAWSAAEPLLRSFDPVAGVPLNGTVLAPVRSPRKLICADANCPRSCASAPGSTASMCTARRAS